MLHFYYVRFWNSQQSTFEKVEKVSCTFTNPQVNLFISTLLNSWNVFTPTQGGIVNLNFIELLFNIVQQHVVNISRTKPSKFNAFYVKEKIQQLV